MVRVAMVITQRCIVASLSLCSTYLFYLYIYCSHQLLKTNVLNGNKLPSFAYLYMKYVTGLMRRRAGHLSSDTAAKAHEIVYTVLNCRLENSLMRRFCCAAGYGWDYPDTAFRDIPLCFPEILCCKLLLMFLTDQNFRLSPAGLIRVRQSVKSLQPVDELKKGPFMLQVRVLQYQQIAAGVEVDICLSATSRSGCPVWESILTLLSRKTASGCLPKKQGRPGELNQEDVKQVELQVPRTIGLQCVWSFSDYSPHRLCSLPAWLLGFRSQIASPLWMLSVCLAEIEKHKGVEVITAPVNITAHFQEPLLAPGKVLLRFWEEARSLGQSSRQDLNFQMEQQEHSICHIVGLISRSS